ncbi:MAG: FHA domain-containing protein [Planctomycetes bacterium]|nr:FHA domain-containing protein [Planctomycetota bacterium]
MNQLAYQYEGKRVEVALTQRPVSLGRGEEADHRLPGKTASRIHAQVFQREGAWHVEDLGSSNGTLVNGKRIAAPTALKPGDEITIGEFKLTLEGDPPRAPKRAELSVARLVYQPAGKPATELVLHERITIGRRPDNSLQIDQKAVSGHHLEVLNQGGTYLLRDLGSSNGTFVGDQPVKEHVLCNGDVVNVGKVASLYFIDPAGAAAGQATPAAPPEPAQVTPSGRTPKAPPPKPAAKASSAAGASDRGSFEPISAHEPQRPVGPNPLPQLAVGVVLFALLLAIGWFGGGFIYDMRAKPPETPDAWKPREALADAALSLEGEIDNHGNPAGWTASFEAANKAKADLLSDPEMPFDGARSLRVSTSGLGAAGATLVLQAAQARKFELGHHFEASLAVRGEGVSGVAIAFSIVGDKEEACTLCTARLPDVKIGQWTEVAVPGVLPGELPSHGRLRVLVSGNFGKLWLDRIELRKAADDTVVLPFSAVDAGGMKLRLDSRRPGRVSVGGQTGSAVTMEPRLVSFENRTVSEPDLWCIGSLEPDAVAFRAMMAGRGEIRGVELRAAAARNEYFSERGLRLDWRLSERGGASLALDLTIPLTDESTVMVADRRGAPLVVERSQQHAYPYATISELTVSDAGFSLAFPAGVVAWFDLSSPGVLVVTVRAALESARDSLGVDVHARPLMFARLYDRMFKEGERLWQARHCSAAEVRFNYLTSPSAVHRDLAVVGKARDRLIEIAAARINLRETADKAWQEVSGTRSRRTIEEALAAVLRYIAEFPGDEETVRELNKRREQLEDWAAEAAIQKRTPEQQKEAEGVARAYYDAADAKHKEGNVLLALVMLENILREYADTTAFREAKVLYDQINKDLADPAKRDAVINAELARIDEDIKFEDYAHAREKCLKLFRRFPDTPRNRDIMQRLRRIESAFEK